MKTQKIHGSLPSLENLKNYKNLFELASGSSATGFYSSPMNSATSCSAYCVARSGTKSVLVVGKVCACFSGKKHAVACSQICQMVYFQNKNPNLGKFVSALDWKMLVYFMAIWYIFTVFED
jgi:hypothetical protein